MMAAETGITCEIAEITFTARCCPEKTIRNKSVVTTIPAACVQRGGSPKNTRIPSHIMQNPAQTMVKASVPSGAKASLAISARPLAPVSVKASSQYRAATIVG
ncbi:hypothetical protein [Ketogulonicigenium vulgare]|uniref:hypothetical protein n=1 Tax=Ketogulonicigenium vulgare TaxID=92945 RepID=UPI001391B695|nr:hypothetical protein [Ketogulonicigenium vulgare]